MALEATEPALQIDRPAVGVSCEDNCAGAVNVLYGGAAGLSATGNQSWHQNSSGVLGTANVDDSFGFALAAGGGL